MKEVISYVFSNCRKTKRVQSDCGSDRGIKKRRRVSGGKDDLLETIASAISKLQMIEDKYYYSLDLNRYLNNLEDDAYEE